jgi:endo-1,4-beta-xylanase
MKQNQNPKKQIKILSQVIMRGVLSLSALSLLFLASCSNEKLDEQNSDIKQSSGFVNDEGISSRDGTGMSNGYFWTLYTEGGGSTLTNGARGNFSIGYQNVRDVVGGKGWATGSGRTINYNVGALSGGYNFVGVYGWTRFPLIEYYVSEKGSIPGSTRVNTVNSDGHTYTFYKNLRRNAPSIESQNSTFWQYIDNWGGQTFNGNKSINMANHINNWKRWGGQGFGSTYGYQVFGLEAFNGKSGYINATVW